MQAVGPTSARNGPPLPPVSIPSIGVIAIPPSMSQKAGTSATDPFKCVDAFREQRTITGRPPRRQFDEFQ
jgi:hypothetical protein